MTVQTTLASLSTTAASNGPDGASDPPSALDDALRYHGAFIAQIRDALMPVGSVIAYDGLVSALPANWKVCDGTNGTPDLRDRFVIGASSTKPAASTGGSANAILISHLHTVSGNTGTESVLHTHGVIDPGHAHTAEFQTPTGGSPGLAAGAFTSVAGATGTSGTGISLGGETALHTHAFSGTTNTAGGDGTNANLPPYYALVWIKRTA